MPNAIPLYKCRLLTTNRSRKILVISFNSLLRNNNWGLYFGEIQDMLIKRQYENKIFDDVTFELAHCIWIDPIPIMSILLSAKIFKRSFGGYVNFRFAFYKLDQVLQTDKALKFLATEGFLLQASVTADRIYFGENRATKNDLPALITSISNIDTKLNYTNCTVIQAQLVNTSELYDSKQKIEDWLNKRLEEAKIGLSGKESDLAIQHVVYKIKILLDETLHNIFQHAYDGNEAWASIYVRFRHGTRNKSISIEERTDLQNNIKLESEFCPRLDSQFAEENSGFAEVFILDGGIGIASTYGGKEKVIEFRNAIDEIFNLGKRRASSEQRNLTARGGLNLIYDLLQQDRDYICGYSDSQWVGGAVPFNKVRFLFYDPQVEQSVCASGLSWIFRLSLNSSIHLNSEDWKTWTGSLYDNPAFMGYKDPKNTSEELRDFHIFDRRFGNHTVEDLKRTTNNATKESELRPVIVLLNRPLITKIDVWDSIGNALSKYPALAASKSRVLIIGDIPEKEALTYSAALIQARIFNVTDAWKSKISDLILITQKLYVCVLHKEVDLENSTPISDKLTFIKDEDYTNQYLQSLLFNESQLPSPVNSIREYVNFIKSYDSYLFWSCACDHPLKKYLYINQKIKWGEPDTFINGYLNFSLTLTQIIFTKLYKLSLIRCYGLFHNKIAVFRNTDDLTIKLCEEFNGNLEIKDLENSFTLYLGSVFGSGTNEYETLSNFPKNINDLIVNFFIHPGVEDFRPRISLLFWPDEDELKKYKFGDFKIPFQRIGKSHSIAQYGWKYFPIPRYDANDRSFYKRNPKDTYTDWQSINNAIVSFGNVSYQGFTDLLRVDIKKALEFAFKYKTELAKYLISEFALALNVTKEEDFYIKEYFLPNKEASLDYMAKREFYENIGLVVYPNHLNTSIAIGFIQENFKNVDTENQLIPVDFTQSYHESNAYLISPLTLERIKEAMERQFKRGRKNVLFFDCTIVSGRTRKQIYHILEGLGAGEIKTLTILDRSRMPYNLPKSSEMRAYWRLDVPRLAYGDYNPINSSLEEIFSIQALFTEPAKVRFLQWSKAWGNSSLGIIESENGIEPSRLPISAQQSKKFGIYNVPPHGQVGGEVNKIDLVNSFGLSLYCAEAHSMTGRDDIALSIIEKTSVPPSIIIELISSQLLLFPHDFSRDLRLRMLKQLFQSSLSIEESDNHTSLAAIVLLRQDESIIKTLFRDMYRVQNMPDSTINLDLRISMAYLVNKFKLQDFVEIDSYDSILIKNQDDSIWEIYRRFHFEIYEGKGKIHSRPILEIFSSQPKSFEQKLQDAIVSFSRLKSIFKEEIKEWYLRNNSLLFTHSTIVNKMDDCYMESLAILNSRNRTGYLTFSHTIEHVTIPFLQEVHKALFYPIFQKSDAQVIRKINVLLSKMIKNISDEMWSKEAYSKSIDKFEKHAPVILISLNSLDFPAKYKSHDTLWVAFDRRVQEKIENLLYNALYAGEQFTDPNITGDNRKAHMWIWVDYSPESITLYFANSIVESKDKVAAAIRKGYNDAHRHCVFEKALGGKSDFPNLFPEISNILTVSLTLPIL